MNILIGSQALALRCNSFKIKKDADWDIISNYLKKDNFKNKRVEIKPYHGVIDNSHLKEYTDDLVIIVDGVPLHVLTLKGLAIVKRSHLWRDWFFDKHIFMYTKYLKSQEAFFNEEDRAYLKQRTDEHIKYFSKIKVNLRKTPEEFFNNYVDREYNHDYLHTLVAYNEKPMYTRLQINGDKSVWCEKTLWDGLSQLEKIQTVLEEVYVIALERFIIPHKVYIKIAFMRALKMVCTNLTSGWFRDFAIDNYTEIMLSYDKSKLQFAFDRLTPKNCEN